MHIRYLKVPQTLRFPYQTLHKDNMRGTGVELSADGKTFLVVRNVVVPASPITHDSLVNHRWEE